ncbi:putative sodium-coupled neutral amino acid transporter 11 [Lineus longissimus]|uniref:putative sodium-coupled neutral amino acid transporter 11 n=1 Tax=Lineus longissimus TaxID=88925 RepID=UPI00315E01B9
MLRYVSDSGGTPRNLSDQSTQNFRIGQMEKMAEPKEETQHLVESETQPVCYTDEKDEEDSDGKSQNKSGIFGVSFNICNATIGNGLVATPFAIAKCGILLGTALLILVALVADYALRIIIKAGNFGGAHSYQELMHKAFGKKGFYLITVMQFFFSYLSLISYLILIGDTLAGLIAGFTACATLNTILNDHRFLIFLAAFLVIFPLSLIRDVSRYSKVSCISIFMILAMTTVVLFNMAHTYQENEIPVKSTDWPLFSWEFPNGVSIIAVLYACHHMSFMMYDSLRDKTEKTWAKAVHLSMAAMLVIILAFSIGGYATYRQFTQADFSQNFCIAEIVSGIFRIALTITLMFIYPLDCFVVKTVIEESVFRNHQPQPFWRNVIIVILILTSTAAIAMFTSCVDIVLELNGIINALPVVFILPPLCLIKLRPEPLKCIQNIVPVLTSLLGFIFFVLGTFQVVLHFIHGLDCENAQSWPYCPAGPCDNYTSTTGPSHHFMDSTTPMIL